MYCTMLVFYVLFRLALFMFDPFDRVEFVDFFQNGAFIFVRFEIESLWAVDVIIGRLCSVYEFTYPF